MKTVTSPSPSLFLKARSSTTFHAASDGQLGGIMKVYRDWQISGDMGWLKEMYPWPGAASITAFAPGIRITGEAF